MALQEEFEIQGNYLFRHRGLFPILILVIGYLVYMQIEINHKEFPYEDSILEEVVEIIAFLLSFFGLAIRIFTVGHTPANTSGRNTDGQLADQLNTTGIYSAVRHPLYLGNFFMWFGVCLWTANVWFTITFVFLYWLYYERIMFAEEQFLRKKFGVVYTTWASVTPTFIPSGKNYEKSKLRFSWRKALKKEKNGFVALFLIYFVFDASGKYFEGKSITGNGFLFYGAIASVILYFILKYIKMYTRLLDEAGR